LELSHHPTLSSRESALHTDRTLIPLQQQHLDTIRKHLYTTRFVVESGRARPYSASGLSASPRDPAFPGVPDGVYQIDRGNVQRVTFGGMLEDLPADHPLYGNDPKLVQKLFNLGIDFNTAFQPTANSPFPNRYAYFRSGSLYLLNAPLLDKDDPALIAFNKREAARQEKGYYIAFQDYGPPKDRQFMRTFGLKVPEGYYLVLGDNHAVSGDSRVMGFIPEENLRGVPDLLLWPPGSRWLAPEETPYPIITTSRLVVWGIIALIALGYFCYHRRKIKQPIFKKIK
jgi:signal peptidase I